MGKLILITGDLATGKSTFARGLAHRYQTNVFCKDVFKEILGDTIGFSNREENLKLSVASAALMRMILSEFCQLNKNLILESNFRQAELDMLHEIAQENGYAVLTLRLQGDLHILHQRFLHRLHHENRHPVHACGGFEDFDAFCNYVTQQRKLVPPGLCIEVRADTFDYQLDATLIQQLDSFMEEGNT